MTSPHLLDQSVLSAIVTHVTFSPRFCRVKYSLNERIFTICNKISMCIQFISSVVKVTTLLLVCWSCDRTLSYQLLFMTDGDVL